MNNYEENFDESNDLDIEFVLTKDDFKKIILDNFDEKSTIYNFFKNLNYDQKDTEINDMEINDFLENLYDTEYSEYEKLLSVLYAFYECKILKDNFTSIN